MREEQTTEETISNDSDATETVNPDGANGSDEASIEAPTEGKKSDPSDVGA